MQAAATSGVPRQAWRWHRLQKMDAPHISRFVLRFFRYIVRGYFRRHFTAVRLSRASNLLSLGDERLIIYANHSSWWDPMISVLLGEKLMPGRAHYAPMDAASLERYKVLKQIGIFGVDMNSARGAARFIRGGLAVLKRRGVLWVTPQGRFADARARPLEFKPGLAALAGKVPNGCTIQPVAIEYVFWNERLPEALLHFGEPLHVDGQSAAELQPRLEAALLATMEELQAMAIGRCGDRFTVLRRGKVGTGGLYAIGQRLLALMHGRPFQAEHTAPSSAAPDGHG